ncbi:hypothetical protein OIE66_23455 [Nonomuraea sp. NBC_01738]|nr:hypothetical protein OIE66_23455 [Nonomuraea sp. NBC_01738]
MPGHHQLERAPGPGRLAATLGRCGTAEASTPSERTSAPSPCATARNR